MKTTVRTAVETLIWLIEDAFEGDPDHSLIANIRELRDEDWSALPSGLNGPLPKFWSTWAGRSGCTKTMPLARVRCAATSLLLFQQMAQARARGRSCLNGWRMDTSDGLLRSAP
jgi:hypothetical protein